MADLAPNGNTLGGGEQDTKSETHQCFSAVWVVMPWLCCVLAAVQSRAAPQPRRLSQLSSRGRAQALWCRLQQLRLTGCAAQAEWLRHTGLACGVLPDEGRSPVSPALLGGFLTTTLAGKPPRRVLLTGLCSLGMLLCLLPDQDKVLAVR